MESTVSQKMLSEGENSWIGALWTTFVIIVVFLRRRFGLNDAVKGGMLRAMVSRLNLLRTLPT